jgi:hypothetical protein
LYHDARIHKPQVYLPWFENTDNSFLVKNIKLEALKVKLKSFSCLLKQQHGD